MTNPADSFFGESSPSAKFDAIGTTVGGVITRIGDPCPLHTSPSPRD